MEKMFYSIEEAASRLGKSVEEVRQMATRGQLQEFRDRDKLMFKKEQVDLLAGGDDGLIPLAGDSGELSLSSSGTGMTVDPTKASEKESTGIAIFEAEGTDDADANAVTRITTSPSAAMQDPGKSGSGSGGLLDLTKEADDTSLGAGLMEDVYGSETIQQQTAVEAAPVSDGGALFESPAAGDAEVAAMPAAVAVEAYDGKWSGILGGAAAGSAIALLIAAFAMIIGFTSTAGGGMLSTLGNSFWILVGVAAGAPILFAILGLFLGKR